MAAELSQVSNQELIRTTPNVGSGWGAALSDTYEVLNPATGASIISMSSCGRGETEAAIKQAHSAFAPWSRESAFERSEVLLRWRDGIVANREDIARIMTLECGKPLQEARNEITAGVGSLAWFAGEAVRVTGQVLQPTGPNKQMVTLKQPVGVVGAITPWNFPFSMITRKVAPAIACGCTVVLKPSEQTPLTAYALAHLAREAGVPDGVFNVVSGDANEIGEALLGSTLVRKIGFTGSTKVGKYLMERSAATVKRISMELGGNAPFLVFDDADLPAAAKAVVASGLRNAGQTCICANRILVQESIHDEFSKLVTKEMQQVEVGNGLDSGTTMGPCINQAQADFAQEHVDDAVKHGAAVLCGGSKPQGLGRGFFFSPTLLGNATRQMRVYQEETFAPVIPLFKFKTQAEGIEMANDTPYGLAAYFFSKDLSRVWHVASELEYGMIGVNDTAIVSPNAPFGGVKQSGLGREHGESGIDEFLEEKFVAMGLQAAG